MSFFGFDTSLPRDRGHPVNAPGFGQAPDPFASLSGRRVDADEDDALDFEDTYDGLGDQLDETDDAFNDETFGGTTAEASSQKAVGKDFDFYGKTAKVSDAINEEQMRYERQQPPPKSVAATASAPVKPPAKATRTGYEKYKEPGYIPELAANPSIWGTEPKNAIPAPSGNLGATPDARPVSANNIGKKMMSLEEVEADMRAKAKKQAFAPPQDPIPQGQLPPQQPTQVQQPQLDHRVQAPRQQQQAPPTGPAGYPHPSQQRSKHPQNQNVRQSYPAPMEPSHRGPAQARQILQRPSSMTTRPPTQPASSQAPTPQAPIKPVVLQPVQILQNHQRHAQQQPSGVMPQISRPQSGGSLPLVTHPEQILDLSDEQRMAYLQEDAKRAKRNHKIHLLSRLNGLMTPQDKNFITRIQLQQLVSATGNPNEQGTDASLEEDFYYQVHTQIRGGPRQNPSQPLNHFAQTYLFQTGGRYGLSGRRLNRGGDNHMQRMEQQVQRAVEAAKAKPKHKQLVIEGSLGKISFSNSKTPKPLLNIRHPEGSRTTATSSGEHDRKAILGDIEKLYDVVMRMEEMERHVPPPLIETDMQSVHKHEEFATLVAGLNAKLLDALHLDAPMLRESSAPHPFIAMLSYPKGKKIIPRVFRHVDRHQQATIFTVVFFHVSKLDCIRNGIIRSDQQQLPLATREDIELFVQAILPCMFAFLKDAASNIILGLFHLLLESIRVEELAMTKVGVMILTTIASCAELLKEGGTMGADEQEVWTGLYNRFFDSLEHVLPIMFPGSINAGEDTYVWQLLAAVGVNGSPDQQQRLVLAVRDRVTDTIAHAKTLPVDMAAKRLGDVNLFLRAIGLDVDMLA